MSSRRQLVRDKVIELLGEVTIANGYNTQPAVVEDSDEASRASEAAVLWVTMGPETTEGLGLGGHSTTCTLTLGVNGMVRREHGELADDLEALLQDARKAIASYYTSFPSALSASITSWGDVETDEGELADRDLAFFRMTVKFIYINGANW